MNYKAFFISLYILTNIMNIEAMVLENTIPQKKTEAEPILYNVSILNADKEQIGKIEIEDTVTSQFSYFNNMIEYFPQTLLKKEEKKQNEIFVQENFVSLKTLQFIIAITKIYVKIKQEMRDTLANFTPSKQEMHDTLTNFTPLELITLLEALNYLGVNPEMLQTLLPEFSFFLINKFIEDSSFSKPTDLFYFLYRTDIIISSYILQRLLIPIEEKLSFICEQKLITKHKQEALSFTFQVPVTPLSMSKNGSFITAHTIRNGRDDLIFTDIYFRHNPLIMHYIEHNFIIDYHPIINNEPGIKGTIIFIAHSKTLPELKILYIVKAYGDKKKYLKYNIFSFASNFDKNLIFATRDNTVITIEIPVEADNLALDEPILYTHENNIVTIAVSPDNQIIALLDSNGMLYFYSLVDKKIITAEVSTPLTPDDYNEKYKPYLAFNATSNSLLLSTNPKNTKPSIIAWDITPDNTLKEISRLSVDNNIISAAWSPDGKNIALLMPEEVGLYQIHSNRLIHRFKMNTLHDIEGKSTSFVNKNGNLFLFIPSTITPGSSEPSLALLSTAQEQNALSNLLSLQNRATDPKLSLLTGLILLKLYTEKSTISNADREVLKQLSFQSRNFLSQLDDQLYSLEDIYFNQIRNIAKNSFSQVTSIIDYLKNKFNAFNWQQKAATGACVGAACVLGAFAYKRLLKNN